MNKALVLFSGGQDSAICLAWALARFDHVETVGFAYGQNHLVEMEVRRDILQRLPSIKPGWSERLGPDHVVDLSGLGAISETALTRSMAINTDQDGLPSTFVPGRNLAFLVFAGAIAYRREINHLIGGMCQTDFSGYPDCHQDTLDAQMQALSLGLDRPMKLETPLMHLTKGQSWDLAEEIGGAALVELVVNDSHSCYRGDHHTRHDWGLGCGTCPACLLRAQGWSDFLAHKTQPNDES